MSSSRLELIIDSRQAERELRQLQGRLDNLDRAGVQAQRSARGLSSALSSVQTVALAAGGAFAAMGLSSLGQDVFNTVASVEKMRASLVTVTGSIESANAAWDQMREFAKTTPFELDQSVQAFIRMKALGLDPTEEALRSFANTSAAMGTDLMQMVEAVADATTGEFERLKEYGIKASQDGEKVALTFQGTTTTIGNNAKEIQSYLENIGNTNFADAAIDQMDTLSGKANNLSDSITDLYLAIGAAGATDVFNDALDGSADAVALLNSNVEVLANGIDLLADAAVIAGGVFGARMVSALAAGALSTKTSMAVTRAHTIALAENNAQDMARIATLSRRVAAEKADAASSAQIAAQRAAQDRAAAAQDAQRLASTQAALTAERELETQRLQAQISATGRQQSIARIAELRASETAIANQLTAANARLTEAEAAETSAKRASSLATAESTRADEVATMAKGKYTAAATAATRANGLLAASARAASGALALVGGPVGAAVLAGGAMYYFRDSLGFASAEARETRQEVDQLVGSIEGLTKVQFENQWRELSNDAADARAEVRKLEQQIESLQERASQESVMYQGRGGAASSQITRLQAELQEQLRILDAAEEGVDRYTKAWEDFQRSQITGASIFRTLDQWLFETGDSASNASTQFDALNYTLGTGGEKWDDYIGKLTSARDTLGMTAAEAANFAAVQQGFTGLYAEQAGAVAGQTAALEDYRSAIQEGNSAEAEAHLERARRYAEAEAMVLAQLQNIDTLTNLLKGVQTELSATALSAALVVGGSAGNVGTMLANAVAAINERAAAIQRTTTVTVKNTAASRAAEAAERDRVKALDDSISAYADLFAELSPVGAAQAEYNETVARLSVAYEAGTKSAIEYYAAIGQAANIYNEAVAASDPYAKELKRIVDQYDSAYQRGMQLQRSLQMINQAWRDDPQNGEQYARVVAGIRDEIEQLALEADPLAQEMARLWEEAGERIDETFADAFRGAFDSFSSFSDQLADGFKRLLAELAYQATLKPIVVGFTQDMQGLLGIGGGSSSGGFGGFGGIGSLISGGKSLLGLGSTAATGTALSGGFMGAAATQSAGSLYGMAATGGVAQAGLASSIAAGISTAMPWIAGGLAIDSLLGGGITKAIGGLFGSKSRGPSFDLMTTHQDPNTIFEDVQHGVTATGAFGNVGFHGGNTNRLEETFGSFDNAKQFLETIAATDDMMAALSPKDVEAMTYAIQQMRIQSNDAAGITEQLGNRTKAAFGAMSGDFGAFARTLSGSTEEIIAQAQATQQAHALLTSASERLGLQFNVTGGYAYEAAQDVAQLAGGVENLAALQQSYYQNYFSEAERAAHLTADLTGALGSMGLQLPETREGFRQLVEAQDLSTESGRQAYAQLLQLSASFSELTPAIEGAGDAASGAADALREREQLERQLLTLQGNTAELRRRDLEATDASNRSLKQRIWALEDEQEAQREAEKAQQERIRAIEQEASAWQRAQQQLASFGVSIDSWIDGLQSTDKGLASPGDQLAAASQAFDEQYAKALSGDQAALGSITQYADRFIEAQKGWSASGEQTVSTIDRVTGMLEKLPDQLTPEQFLAEEFKGIIDGQTSALLSGWNGGFDSLLSGLSADFGALDTSLDGLLSFDELKAGLAGKATDSELRALIGAVDKNGDGLISKQELTNATISDLRLGITSTLSKSFADLDSNVDGLLTFGELKTGLGGIATDAQLKAMMQGMDLNNDSVVDKLESVVVSAMPTDGALTNVLRNQMQDLRTKTLTSSQVRAALRPIATDAEIENLIKRVDANGDGIISEQELANSRLDSLSQGIAGALEPMFSSIDLDASGLIDYSEFGKAFEGMATDEQLKNIFSELDRNGDGVISALEAVRRSSMDTEGSIKTIEDFFYRAGSPSWGLRVSMSHHQNVDAVKSFGYHTAKEMRREFSPSGTGIGVSLAAPQNGDGARSIATAFKQILGPNRVDGSHASGAWNIGFDGYLAELHKGEMVVPAGPAQALRELAAGDSSMSMASMPAPAVTMSAPPLPQFPLLDQTDVTQVMRDMQRTIEQKNEQIVELLKEVRGNTGQTRDAVMGVGKGAHQQREQQSRQLDRLNRNTKEKVRTP